MFSAKSVLIASLLQISLVILFGLIFSSILKIYYSYIRYDYEVFKQREYRGDLNGILKRFRFAAIKRNNLGQIEDEKIYSIFGDYTHIEYYNNKWKSTSTLLTSTLIIVFFALMGMLMLFIANSAETYNLNQSSVEAMKMQELKNNGGILFIASMISAAIKLVFDFIYVGYE